VEENALSRGRQSDDHAKKKRGKHKMREAEQVRQDMEFQLSLFRLMTVPHEAGAPVGSDPAASEAQMEQLFQLAESGYRS
jgi:hypothetical protein